MSKKTLLLPNNNYIMAANQPNLWPSLSFWYKMRSVDIFVILDDAQYTKSDFHNRQRIRANSNEQFVWLRVPVFKKGTVLKEIEINNDAKFNKQCWNLQQLDYIKNHYSKAPYFSKFFSDITSLYHEPANLLVDFNMRIIEYVKNIAGINTRIIKASELRTNKLLPGSKSLIQLCEKLGVKRYLSGSGALKQRTFHANDFEQASITLEWLSFTHPFYSQLYQPFLPNMGVLDALFCTGKVMMHTPPLI